MIEYYKNFKNHNFIVVKNKCENIFTFDIETTSIVMLNGKIYPAIKYDNFTEVEKETSISLSSMYIWQLGIDDHVYFGRTWDEFIDFLKIIEKHVPEKKIFYVHNLRIRVPIPS